MVVLDKDRYIEKVENLLVQPAYRTIDRDPTNKLKAQLILKLRRIKREPTWMRACIELCTLLVASPQDLWVTKNP